jgi:signal transduction histidine kinase
VFKTKGVGERTGLGLNTAQVIVRKLGGNIQVTSKPGDTRFQVLLPWQTRLRTVVPVRKHLQERTGGDNRPTFPFAQSWIA